MTNDSGVVRAVAWRNICAWTLLFRTFRVAISIPVLLLALGGTLATAAGWRLLEAALSEETARDPQVRAFLDVARAWPGQIPVARDAVHRLRQQVWEPRAPLPPADTTPASAPAPAPATATAARVGTWFPCYLLVEPFRRLFDPGLSWGRMLLYLTGGLWTLSVWVLFGGATARIAAVRLGRDEQVGLRDAVVFARGKWPSLMAAPLMPLLAITLVALPIWLLGLMMRLNLGVAIAGLGWVLVALFGLVMAVFGIGLLFGWPLMWSTIATEGSDAFDAVSRSYAYTFQRPLHYLAYAVLAGVLGVLGWLLVALFCETVLRFIDWGICWGTGVERFEQIRGLTTALAEPKESTPSLLWFGSELIRFFNACVRSLTTAFSHGYFWVAVAGIYLLLRRDADQTETDDVYLEDESETPYGLPELPPDEAGVPGVSDEDDDAASPGGPSA